MHQEAHRVEQPLRILIVEDNQDAAESLALLLRLRGHEYRVASDGSAALAAAELFHPDIVLLDIGLPGMDGYEVAKNLRHKKVLKKPVLIAITGHGLREERLRSYESGVDMHMTKPVTPEELLSLLDRFQAINRPRNG